MKSSSFRSAALLALAMSLTPSLALAETDAEQVRATTAKLIDLLVEKGVLTRDKAEALVQEMNKPAPPVVRVPYMPEFMRKALKDEVQLDLANQAQREGWAKPGSVPEWVRSLQWDGDMRTRVQGDNFQSGNAPAFSVNDTNRNRALTLANTTEDRLRLRVRARLGVTAEIDPNWSSAVRLTTGSANDPLSANQTLGVYNNRYTVLFDRANIRYRLGESFNVVMGRFGNPWFGTDLVWANDLSFDGVTAQWTPRLSENIRGFLTLGALPVQEVELAANDKWLFGVQLGASRNATMTRTGAKLGLGYYHYTNIVGQPSPANTTLYEYTAPQFTQKGNSYYNISADPGGRPLLGLASDYHLVNLTGQLDFPIGRAKRLTVTGDYVRNIGFDREAVSARLQSDIEPMVNGYQLRVSYGESEMRGSNDWQVFAGYKRLERDAVLDAFTDSDFHLGGTDARGYIIGGTYGVGKHTFATVRYFSGDAISGPPLGIDVLQFDLSVRF
jgi:polyhydroxyalkanoate synthesis regulator phasin